MYWVEWKTRNARPAKKSRDDSSPATGRNVKPVQSTVCAKKYPLKFFEIFLATARTFYMKFHTLITHSSSHKITKQHCIIFNYDKVIKFLR